MVCGKHGKVTDAMIKKNIGKHGKLSAVSSLRIMVSEAILTSIKAQLVNNISVLKITF